MLHSLQHSIAHHSSFKLPPRHNTTTTLFAGRKKQLNKKNNKTYCKEIESEDFGFVGDYLYKCTYF